MWEGCYAFENFGDRCHSFGDGTSTQSNSMLVSASSPRLSSQELPLPVCSNSMHDRRSRCSEALDVINSNEEMLVPPVPDEQA
ncbi:unnamed protein product [Anisakis simplex]|uniref:DUF630 domain-containing protein n=1 Tax=Anisakis simplex TaxID=6269 RepID=A0A0M3JYF2_ANISI|nr:unnamed protein product [Anisakis simplex]